MARLRIKRWNEEEKIKVTIKEIEAGNRILKTLPHQKKNNDVLLDHFFQHHTNVIATK